MLIKFKNIFCKSSQYLGKISSLVTKYYVTCDDIQEGNRAR